MGTKNNPGQFDCYANAEPDEPMFVLLARDKHAPILVMLWAVMRGLTPGSNGAKVAEALACVDAMTEWKIEKSGQEPAGIRTAAHALALLAEQLGVLIRVEPLAGGPGHSVTVVGTPEARLAAAQFRAAHGL